MMLVLSPPAGAVPCRCPRRVSCNVSASSSQMRLEDSPTWSSTFPVPDGMGSFVPGKPVVRGHEPGEQVHVVEGHAPGGDRDVPHNRVISWRSSHFPVLQPPPERIGESGTAFSCFHGRIRPVFACRVFPRP